MCDFICIHGRLKQHTGITMSSKRRKNNSQALLLHQERVENTMNFMIFYPNILTMTSTANVVNIMLDILQQSVSRSETSKNRKIKNRPIWSKELEQFGDCMFFWLFQMYRPHFNSLCSKIEQAVGSILFKSEKYI